MKKKLLLAICFAAAISISNPADAMSRMLANIQDSNDDRAAIVGVKSLAEFAALPDNRVERLNPSFVADARTAYSRLTQLGETTTYADLLDIPWLSGVLKANLRLAVTAGDGADPAIINSLEDVKGLLKKELQNELDSAIQAQQTLEEIGRKRTFSDLFDSTEKSEGYNAVFHKDLLDRVKALREVRNLESLITVLYDERCFMNIRRLLEDLSMVGGLLDAVRTISTLSDFITVVSPYVPQLKQGLLAMQIAAVKLNFDLPDSLYESFFDSYSHVTKPNEVGKHLRTIVKKSNVEESKDEVNGALQGLYRVIVEDAGIKSGKSYGITLDDASLSGTSTDETRKDYFDFRRDVFLDSSYTTDNYMRFLSGILDAGKKECYDFSNIGSKAMNELVYDIRNMINCATPEELGITTD